jgi:hypothetical protein
MGQARLCFDDAMLLRNECAEVALMQPVVADP